MSYTVEIQLNNSKEIIKNHGLDENGRVTEFFRNEVDRFCDPYIPMSSGSGVHLKNFKTYPDKSTIKYMAPYSHYHFKGELMLAPNGSSWAQKGEKKHYVGKSMKYQGAPKRGPNWAERMMNDRRQDICKNVENFIMNGGN